MLVVEFIAGIDPVELAQRFKNKFTFSFSFDRPLARLFAYFLSHSVQFRNFYLKKHSMPLGNNLKSISMAIILKHVRKRIHTIHTLIKKQLHAFTHSQVCSAGFFFSRKCVSPQTFHFSLHPNNVCQLQFD